jgi:hypothetical protein
MPCSNFQCCSTSNNKTLSKQEKKSNFILQNSHQREIVLVKLDDCEHYRHLGERVDWILNCKDKDLSIILELKGKDEEKALSQLKNVANSLKDKFLTNRYAFTVKTRTPQTTTAIQRKKKDLKALGFKYESKNMRLEKNLESL